MKHFLKRIFSSLIFTVPLALFLAFILSLLAPHLGFVAIVAISTAISLVPGIKAGDSILRNRT